MFTDQELSGLVWFMFRGLEGALEQNKAKEFRQKFIDLGYVYNSGSIAPTAYGYEIVDGIELTDKGLKTLSSIMEQST